MAANRILILGGTTEARRLAEILADRREFEVTISLAGRTVEPKPLPLPTRIGGFGGSDGLEAYLRAENIALLVDATHPFANRISANASEAARRAHVAAFALVRPGWVRQPYDRWASVGSIAQAIIALGDMPRRVFLSIGRQEVHQFAAAPRHYYLVRSVDPVDPPLDVPHCDHVIGTGPFRVEAEMDLFRYNRIDTVVTKNSGGTATYAKIEAARMLDLAVIMIERQAPPGLHAVPDADAAMAMIDHLLPTEK